MTRKELFIENLAEFLTDNQAGKSIACEMERKRSTPPPLVAWALEWSRLRETSPVFGYPTKAEAIKSLTDFLKGD